MPLLPGFSISFLLATVRIGIGKYTQGYPRVILAVEEKEYESILRLLYASDFPTAVAYISKIIIVCLLLVLFSSVQ